MDEIKPRPRDNVGHSLDVLMDLSPYEVDQLTERVKRCDSFDVRRKQVLSSTTCLDWETGTHRIFTPTKPSTVFYDGRAYNQLAEYLYLSDPCRYKMNTSRFVPQRPRSFVPAPGHYDGLGKPPVRRYFKLTPMQVHEDRVMPSYQLLDSENLCQYYQNSV